MSAERAAEAAGRRGPSLGTQVLIGVLVGIGVGLFFGDLCAPLGAVGEVYVGLLQMTVLPYVILSLVGRIGMLSIADAGRLARGAGLTMGALWALTLIVVFLFPLALPPWEAGSFFSSSLIESPAPLNLVALYIPTNWFHSLANNVVPAAVLFSICLGIALIPVAGKDKLLVPLEVARTGLGRIATFVVRLSPYGTFFLTAHTLGTQSPQQLFQIQAYLVLYTVATIFLALVVLPGLVSAVTPISWRHVASEFRAVGLTAFAVGKLFAVLTMIIEGVERILPRYDVPPDEARAAADLYVPLGYAFPNAGRLLTLLFIPFAAWFSGQPLGVDDYPMLLTVGALSLFGSPLAAIPFLLDALRLPSDLFPLFLISGIWCTRLGDLVGSMHLLAFTLISSAASAGKVVLQLRRILVWSLGMTLVGALVIAGTRAGLDRALAGHTPPASRVTDVVLTSRLAAEIVEPAPGEEHRPGELARGQTQLERIRAEGRLRVGFDPDLPPFVYRDGAGALVGFDIDLIQRFAGQLELVLELVPTDWADLQQDFRQDRFDLALGGLASSIEHFGQFEESTPYLETHIALVVPDHRVGEFRTVAQLLANPDLRFGIPMGSDLSRRLDQEFPGFHHEPLRSDLEFLQGERPELDALITSAEVGSVYSILYPGYSVVVPAGAHRKFPLIVAIRSDAPELKRLLDIWIELQRVEGTIALLHRYWILGERPKTERRRWSVVRDVLGWFD